MTQPNPEVDELVELLSGLEFIANLCEIGRGLDVVSNTALRSIQEQAERLLQIVRSVNETTMFGPEELGIRMDASPRQESDL
jgi:hypothetical protein